MIYSAVVSLCKLSHGSDRVLYHHRHILTVVLYFGDTLAENAVTARGHRRAYVIVTVHSLTAQRHKQRSVSSLAGVGAYISERNILVLTADKGQHSAADARKL